MKILAGPSWVFSVLFLLVVSTLSLSAQDWWFEVGPVVRGGMKVSVSGSSYAQQLGLHDPLATGPLTAPGGVGAQNGYADRTYGNGYVNMDPGTGNPISLNPNTTWNWGFNDPAQYNPTAQTLTYSAVGDPGYSTLKDQGAHGSTDFLGTGLQAVMGRKLMRSGKWSLDACVVFQATWSGNISLNASPYSEDVRQITTTDTYDVSGIGAANFPSGGFHGTYHGPFGNPPVIPSPVIPNQPQSRTQTTSAPLSTSTDQISFNVRQSLYELGIGPQIGFQATKQLRLHLRPTISLNIVDAEVQRTETFSNYRWSDSASQVDVLFGIGINGGVNLELEHGFYVGVSGGYDYLPQSMGVGVGPSTITLDPSGWQAMALVGWRF